MTNIQVFLFVLSVSPILSENAPILNEPQATVAVDYSTASMCPSDCKPAHCQTITTCPSGIHSQWDGCRCCKTCSRGQGDMCDYQNPCSETLTCVFIDGTANRGICRSNKTCRLANGRVLQDGETFQPHCSMQCSCQGGLVGCASLCQNDERNMAFAMKGTCQRIRIPNNCCPQWVCDHASSSILSTLLIRKALIEPDNVQLQEDEKHIESLPTLLPPIPSLSVVAADSKHAKGASENHVDVEYVAPLIVLQQQQTTSSKASKMRSIDTSSELLKSATTNLPVANCSGTTITLRSCSLNKCGLRITDDFVASNLTCPSDLIPTFTYCMFRPCTKKRRREACTAKSVPLADFQVKVRHSGCRTQLVPVKYCKSCKESSVNRCCLPISHALVSYNQSCYDGSVRTFYVAQATACSCRSDVFRLRDCQLFYQKLLNTYLLPTKAKIYRK